MGEIKLILRRIAVKNMGKVRCHGVSTMILSSGIALGKKIIFMSLSFFKRN